MSRRRAARWVAVVAVAVAVAACSLDTGVPSRGNGAAPASSGVMLSGESAGDSATGLGDGVVISDITDGQGSSVGGQFNDSENAGAAGESEAGDGGTRGGQGGTASGNAHAGHGGMGAIAGGAGTAQGGGSTSNGPPSLYFSEYVEGSSSNKALEIAASKRSSLEGCKVGAYFNGQSEATVIASLSGVLEAGKVLTVCSSTLKAKLAVCAQAGNLTFNGNDALALACDGKVLDVIGQIGVDPGAAWGSTTNSTVDHTLQRKCSVASGDTNGLDAFNPSGEWQAFPVDTFSGLGSRGCAPKP